MKSKEALRSFIAVELPNEIHDNLQKLQNNLKDSMPDVRWVKYGNIHLTLKFLGDVEVSKIEKISKSIQYVADEFSPFTISLAHIGAFPNFRKPSIIWTGVEEGAEKIVEIVEHIESSMEKLGFAREKRPFRPHLTIGRVRELKHPAIMAKSLENSEIGEIGKFMVEKLSLIKSQLDPSGSIYTTLSEALLRPENA
ncbi:MAG: RNA 2',3'-cyclic phosphodiesterase [bacterium]